MISKASVHHIRISPRKVRYVIDMIRAKTVSQATTILSGSPRRGSDILQKLLAQAVDAAKRNSQVNAEDLMVSKVLADGGPTMKRFRAATMGRANQIKKRTSHIQLELDLKRGATPLKTATKVDSSAKKTADPSLGGKKKAASRGKMVGAK